MRLLIAGIIIFFTAFYFYLIWPSCPTNNRSAHFSILCSHTADTTVLKREFRKIPFLLSGLQSHTDTELNMDVHLSTDGKLVVFHDDDLSRICGRPEAVEVLPSKELQRYRLQDTTETIPLFSEVLSLVDGRCRF